MFNRLKNFILKIRCRRLYKQLPMAVKMQLWFEFNQPDFLNSYNEILKRLQEV